jgi:DNA (cytosine-5)-methyltransferase 1
LGFKQAGYNVLFATDIDPKAMRTYRTNFGEISTSVANIWNLDFKAVLEEVGLYPGELDILIGGPPCQGFSTAGKRFWEDPKNRLLKNYAEAIKQIQPKWFLMENVEGLLTANRGIYVLEAVKSFIELGYQVRLEKIYSQFFGVPQRRKRVLIVGNRLGYNYKLPAPTMKVSGQIFRNSDVTLHHAISGLPTASPSKGKALNYDTEINSLFEQYLRGQATQVTDHYSPELDGIQLARIQALRPGQTMKNLPMELQHKSFQRRAKRRVMDGTPSEKRGGSPSGLKRLLFEEPCPTITGAATRELIHPIEDRPITIRETARIQTFPDDFLFEGTLSQKIQQIGNAIPPMIAKICGEHIRNDYGFERAEVSRGRLLGYQLTKASAMSPALQRTEAMLANLMNEEAEQLDLFSGVA